MLGFRTIAVHRYHELDLGVLRAILDQRLVSFVAFVDLVEPR